MNWTALILGMFMILAGVSPGAADNYPSGPIRLPVPVPPGAINDLVAWLLGESITAHTGQPVVIDNRSGSAGNIAMGATARATPDGYTLLLASGGHITTNRLLYQNASFDPMKDLLPITPVAEIKLIFAVNKKVPATSLQEFIALAKAQPGKINYTSAGPGSTTHFAGDWLTRLAGMELVHVPHRGAAPAVVDVVAGNVEAITLGVNTLAPHIASGDLRALATASAKRLSCLPDVPAAVAAGVPGWEVPTWFGLFGPLGLARETVEMLNGYVRQLVDNPTVKQRMSASYIEPWRMSPEEFSAFVNADAHKWERIVKDSGFQAR